LLKAYLSSFLNTSSNWSRSRYLMCMVPRSP
jgi:hypothetical protein